MTWSQCEQLGTSLLGSIGSRTTFISPQLQGHQSVKDTSLIQLTKMFTLGHSIPKYINSIPS